MDRATREGPSAAQTGARTEPLKLQVLVTFFSRVFKEANLRGVFLLDTGWSGTGYLRFKAHLDSQMTVALLSPVDKIS